MKTFKITQNTTFYTQIEFYKSLKPLLSFINHFGKLTRINYQNKLSKK